MKQQSKHHHKKPQTPRSLYVVARDFDNGLAPIANAKAKHYDAENNLKAQGDTNADGLFMLEQVDNRHKIIVSFNGKRTVTVELIEIAPLLGLFVWMRAKKRVGNTLSGYVHHADLKPYKDVIVKDADGTSAEVATDGLGHFVRGFGSANLKAKFIADQTEVTLKVVEGDGGQAGVEVVFDDSGTIDGD